MIIILIIRIMMIRIMIIIIIIIIMMITIRGGCAPLRTPAAPQAKQEPDLDKRLQDQLKQVHIYIYIYRERERYIYMYLFIYLFSDWPAHTPDHLPPCSCQRDVRR